MPQQLRRQHGDGVVYAGFEGCDDGNQVQDDGCNSLCRLGSCGNGQVDQGEPCDDGNNDDDDACPCGRSDSLRQQVDLQEGRAGYESCDDGNLVDGDGCSAACAASARPSIRRRGGNGWCHCVCGRQGRAAPGAPSASGSTARVARRERHVEHMGLLPSERLALQIQATVTGTTTAPA